MSNYVDDNKKLLQEYLINNNIDAYHKLVENNVKLVNFVINKIAVNYNKKTAELEEEYFDLGCLALEHAINKFDINRIEEISLSTYAIMWIESKITRVLKKRILEEQKTISMEQSVNNEEDDLTIEGTLSDEDNYINDFIEEEYNNYKKDKIQKVLSKFSDEERAVIELYYGFEDNDPKTCYRISNILGINKYRVTKIIEKTAKKLQEYLKEFKNDYAHDDKKQKKEQIEHEINELHEKKKQLLNIIKEYDRKFLKEVFDKIDDEEKRIVFKYCGINMIKSYDVKYISKEMNVDEESVKDIIKTTIDNICDLINKKNNKRK